MTDFWLSAAGTIPALAAILVFLIYQGRMQQASVERNHILWQSWLEKRDAAAAEERRSWQEWIHQRDITRNEEHKMLVQSLAALQAEIRAMSNAVLLRYAVGDGERVKDILKEIEQLKTPPAP